jgi:hypothetical protein
MILSINVEKAFAKIQHPFMIKSLKKLEIEGMFLNILKATYDKPITHIILNGEQLKTAPVKVRKKMGLSTFSIIIQYNFGIVSESNKTRAKNKRNSKRERS